MLTGKFWELDRLGDDALTSGTLQLVHADRRVGARLLAHLSEIEERRLHLKQAFSSMFDYCLSLGMSEDEAGRRLCAASVAKRFPVIYSLVDDGKLSLSVVCKLKHYLTTDNHVEVLSGVSGLSYRKAEAWLAAHFARPDVPATVRKLPQRSPRALAPALSAPSSTTEATPTDLQNASTADSAPNGRVADIEPEPPYVPPPAQARSRNRVEPLSAERYRVQFTADQALREKLELVAELMAHGNPSRDLAHVVSHALDVLIDKLKKERFAATSRPRRAKAAKPGRVTNATKREVAERDGLRCSFVNEHGKRCEARGELEFDHRDPRGMGGCSEASNMRLLCRAHNQYEAERAYGRAHIEQAKRRRSQLRDVAKRHCEEPSSAGVD